MGDGINYTDISVLDRGVVVHNAGNEWHAGLRIALSFKQAGKGSLTFSASHLSEHPDLIILRFSNDASRFDRFGYRPIDAALSFLSAFIYLSGRDRTPRRVSVGRVRNPDLLRLEAFAQQYGIELRRE